MEGKGCVPGKGERNSLLRLQEFGTRRNNNGTIWGVIFILKDLCISQMGKQDLEENNELGIRKLVPSMTCCVISGECLTSLSLSFLTRVTICTQA